MKKATAKKKNKPKEQKSFDSTITYSTRKPNQYFLTRDEIHGLFERYITQFNGNIVTKANVSVWITDDFMKAIKNKDKYSLDDIESKLSVICVRKKVNFNLDDSTENDNKVENENDSIITYNLNDAADSTTPEWIKALRRTAALD